MKSLDFLRSPYWEGYPPKGNQSNQAVYNYFFRDAKSLPWGKIPKGHFPRNGSKNQRPKQYCLLGSMSYPNTHTFFFLGSFWT